MATQKTQMVPHGWEFWPNDATDYEVGLDNKEKHTGTRSAYLQSLTKKPKKYCSIMNWFRKEEYLDKRLRMSAWVKTELTNGKAYLWLRVDGDWGYGVNKPGCFDQMDDRQIKGTTKWTRYHLVVDVPKTSTKVAFGLILSGTGRVWLDDVSFETVSKKVPLTGKWDQESRNLSFEENNQEGGPDK